MFEIKGTFRSYTEVVKESKAGKPYTERLVLIETDDKYSPIMAFQCTEKAGEFLKTQPYGSVGTFTFNYKSNEFNGRWFSQGSIFRADISATATHEANYPSPAANNGGFNDGENVGDMPF